MSRRLRMLTFVFGAIGVAVLLGLAFVRMPHFGGGVHPYRDHAVAAAVRHHTANVVSSVNFDQRSLDTLGEETILLGSVIGVSALLRRSEDEEQDPSLAGGRVLASTKLLGYVLLPVTLMVGLDVVVHGHLTPGGGFQGGVVLATGLHLLYVAGSYPALERLRPIDAFEYGEAIGAGAFACLGIAGILVAGAFLANVIPYGDFGRLMSAGTVPVLNAAVGVEVASGVVVLLAKFLEQVITIRPRGAEPGGDDRPAAESSA